MQTAAALHGVSKSFGDVRAVADVSLDIYASQICALCGPSGCGKTTILRILAGFEEPDQGTVSVGDRRVAGHRTFIPPERRRVGIVPQNYALFPHLNVRRNVGFGVKDDRATVDQALELVGLTDLGDRYPSELSGGQQQRVAIARALAPKPNVLLLDEPFSSLDPSLRSRIRADVRQILTESGTASVLVTHDTDEALSIADRVAVMSAGSLHQIDTPDRVYSRPADPFVASFVSRANILEGVSDGDAVECSLGRLDPGISVGPGPAIVAVRPESLMVRPDTASGFRIRAVEFYGHDQVLDISTPDGAVVRARTGPGRWFEPGDHVSVAVASDEVVAFGCPPIPNQEEST